MVLKKFKKIISDTKKGFQIGGSAYKGVFTGKGIKPAKDLAKKFRKEELKKNTKTGNTRSRMEAKNRLIHGDEKINKTKKQHQTFKEDRKIKDKGQKSYNKGKPKSEWVNSAYDRRQSDAKKSMQNAAATKHADWKKMRAGKMSKAQFIKKYPNSGTARDAR
tara:strand:+ start:71 stop:556 length:486 start_codon:yes stop_codon:yes gene_type:complete